MSTSYDLQKRLDEEYKYGFVTAVEEDTVPVGLNEAVIRHISGKKGEPAWMLEWRLQAYRWWLTQKEPRWAHLEIPDIDYQAIRYYSAPKGTTDNTLDPEIEKTFDRLGVPLHERKQLQGRCG